MPRLYTCPFENVSSGTAAQDFWELSPADDKPVAIAGIWLDNVGGTADMGDAQEEGLRLGIYRGFTTSGSGGSTVTPNPTGSSGDVAAGFTCEINNTTVATTSGTLHTAFGWNPRIPCREWLPENAWIFASQANTTLLVRLIASPADAFPVSGTLWVMEYP
jgi:hypothetical protein